MKTNHMQFVYCDGGREAAGFRGASGDCVVRSVAIATGIAYRDIYDALSEGVKNQRLTKRNCRKASARNGVNTSRKWFRDYMESIGWMWMPTMLIGQGCKVHLVRGELPMGRLIVSVSKHYTCVIDGIIYDTHDPQRITVWFGDDGHEQKVTERCVYGYWTKKTAPAHEGEVL